MTGGFNAAEGFQLASCEVYDANANTWTEIDPLPVPVDNHAATLVELSTQLPDVVMVTGGRVFNADLNLFEGVASGAMLNVEDLTWTPFDMASPHSYHLSTHLDHAAPELFVMGGADQTGIGVETTYGSSEWLLGTDTQPWSPPVTTRTVTAPRDARRGPGSWDVTQCVVAMPPWKGHASPFVRKRVPLMNLRRWRLRPECIRTRRWAGR